MKRITAVLLALCLLTVSGMALPINSASASASDFAWVRSLTDNSVYIEEPLHGEVTIPSSLDGEEVYALCYSALRDQNEVTSLTMPDTLYALQDAAISNMQKLESVTLNDGLEVIRYSNFRNCPALTSLTIPASVKVFEGAIDSCDNLREIRFEGVCPTFMRPRFCFYWLPDDYVIYVPDDQLDAYAEALQDANGAAEHLRPSGKNAVRPEKSNCEEWFVFEEYTGSITGYKGQHAYVEIPESIGGVPVQNIAEDAFADDYSLYALVFPEGLERIENRAFYGAGNLLYIKFPSTLEVICDDAFYYVRAERIDWSEGLREIGARAFGYNNENILSLPSTLKTIGDGAFEHAHCQELYLSGELESIGSRAFASNTFLSYMAFDFYEPIEIAADAFAETDVADLDLPWDSSFENRAQYAEILRDQCPSCTVWINNPEAGGVAEYPVNDESVSTFENGVWTMYKGDQPKLTAWTSYNDIQVTGLGDGLFKGNQTIHSFYPHHCGWFTTIGNEAFADSSVEYVELFGSIETIGSGAFRNCLNLKTLTLPASLTSIGEDALAGCDNLEELIVLCDPAILPDGLLDECSARTTIYAAPDTTAEQVRVLSEKAHRPWYAPVSRLGEPTNDLIEMPYAMFLIDDFWYDTEYARLDRYHGYELNLYLPREAEGMTLNTLGGDLMGRARGGDNYEMELPVRSVVIPENYTNIYSTTFAGCETLETVICYAPLETTAAMFEGCTNLREVIFVNGVRSLGRGVFYGCDKLETVYVGPYVEEVSDEAFIGCSNFDLSKCITDPALMPDLDALLEAVKSDPISEPTPAPTAAPAMPVGEAGAPYVGVWNAVTLEMEGEAYSVADMGMEMNFTLNADGTAESYDGEATETGTWTIENGTIVIGSGIEGMVPMTVNEAGQLVMEEDGMKLIFVKSDSAAEPEALVTEEKPVAPVSEDGASYVGTWMADTLEMDGEVYPVADMGLEMYFTLNADGTAESYDGETTETCTWTFENGAVVVDDFAIQVTEDGRLLMEDEESKLFFVKSDASASEPEALVTEEKPVAPVSEDGASYVGTWMADTLEMDGEVYPVAVMGLEMYFTLNADGTAESYDGETTETCTWTFENGAVVVDDFAIQVTEDGRLLMEDEESKLFFVKSDASASEPEAPVTEEKPVAPVSEDSASYVGTWAADTLEMDGEVYPVAVMGLEMYFTLNADGTAESYDGEATETGTWTIENGSVIVEGMPLAVTEEGKLVMEEDGMKLVFVKSDASASEPEALVSEEKPVAPVSEDGASYVGTWAADTLEMDGEVYPVAVMGLEMYFTLNADGTAESYDGEATETGTWTIENGSVIVEGMPLAVTEEGKLVMEEDGMKLVFVKSDAVPAVPVTEKESFIGTWYGCYMATGAINGDPREIFEIILTVNEDGTANLAYPTDEPYHWTENEDGSLLMIKDVDGVEMPLNMLNDGYICLGSMDGDGNALGGYIIFSRDALATWNVATQDMAVPEPADKAEEISDDKGDRGDRMETRYVCQSAEANGVTLDASLLGGEYALTFHANGTVDFVMVGNTIPALKWTKVDNAFIIDYYGTAIEVIPTEEGLDMNYFNTMMLHFTAE